jgi:hypothetical protein
VLLERLDEKSSVGSYGRCSIGFGLFPPDVRALKGHAAFHRVPKRWAIGQKGNEDVRLDAGLELVKDRPDREVSFEVLERRPQRSSPVADRGS